MRKKTELAIVNRGFWPQSLVVGEALLRLAEQVAKHHRVCVITQSDGQLRAKLKAAHRGEGVEIRDCRSRSNSSSGLVKRSLDALGFMVWTFVCLVRARPAQVYVSTNPPVVVPFIVFVYCSLFGGRYTYHLQDIHPEAANIVVPLNRHLYKLLQHMDAVVMRNAHSLITLSQDMRDVIGRRSSTRAPIHLVDNPAFDVELSPSAPRTGDFVYCGNAGRLQRIPLLIDAIRQYLGEGGTLRFTFVGAGIYAPSLKQLADEYEAVSYLGHLPAAPASQVVMQHRWALLPIDDEVTRYAFPSKSSSYVLSGCNILAICGEDTSVARWVTENGIGRACEPEVGAVVACFKDIEVAQAAQAARAARAAERANAHGGVQAPPVGVFKPRAPDRARQEIEDQLFRRARDANLVTQHQGRRRAK